MPWVWRPWLSRAACQVTTKRHTVVEADILFKQFNTCSCVLSLIFLFEWSLSVTLHLEVIVRQDEKSETQGCELKAYFCLQYQNTIMLRLDCVKNGEKFWVLSKIWKAIWKLYCWNKFYAWQINPALCELITQVTLVLAGKDSEYLLRSEIFSS